MEVGVPPGDCHLKWNHDHHEGAIFSTKLQMTEVMARFGKFPQLHPRNLT